MQMLYKHVQNNQFHKIYYPCVLGCMLQLVVLIALNVQITTNAKLTAMQEPKR